MKKIVIALLFFAFVLNSHAQEWKKFELSLVATPVLSWLNSDHDNASSDGSRFGFKFGVNADLFFAENYAFNTGLTINHVGGNINYNEEGINNAVTYKLQYIEIPLGVKLRSNQLRRTSFWGLFGLTPMVNIKATDDDDNNLSKEVELFNLGYNIGGGLHYDLGGNIALMGGLVFYNGFTDVTSREGFDDKTIMNNLHFVLGVKF